MYTVSLSGLAGLNLSIFSYGFGGGLGSESSVFVSCFWDLELSSKGSWRCASPRFSTSAAGDIEAKSMYSVSFLSVACAGFFVLDSFFSSTGLDPDTGPPAEMPFGAVLFEFGEGCVGKSSEGVLVEFQRGFRTEFCEILGARKLGGVRGDVEYDLARPKSRNGPRRREYLYG